MNKVERIENWMKICHIIRNMYTYRLGIDNSLRLNWKNVDVLKRMDIVVRSNSYGIIKSQ